MRGLYVVTGGGTGIGAALAKVLSRRDPVLIVGRRLEPLLETSKLGQGHEIRTVVADIATPEGRTAVANAVGLDRIQALVHNAARLDPVGPLIQVEEEEWKKSMAINVDGPLFLTKALLERLKGGGRVLHIGSGASSAPYQGWGTYCTTKAALFMIYRVLALELAPSGVHVGSFRPGIVDTPMQAQIRTFTTDDFPDVERFKGFKKDGALREPDEVAKFIDFVLHETNDEEFSSQQWDISDAETNKRWKDTRRT